MKLIHFQQRFNKLDKMFEIAIKCDNEYFWFYLGMELAKSNVRHLIHTSKDNSIQIYAYLFDWYDEIKILKSRDYDAEKDAKNLVKQIEKFVLNETNKD